MIVPQTSIGGQYTKARIKAHKILFLTHLKILSPPYGAKNAVISSDLILMKFTNFLPRFTTITADILLPITELLNFCQKL